MYLTPLIIRFENRTFTHSYENSIIYYFSAVRCVLLNVLEKKFSTK